MKYVGKQVTMADIANMDAIKKEIASLVGAAPDELNTLEELATAMKENEDVVSALNEAIGSKATKAELEALEKVVNNIIGDIPTVVPNKTLTIGSKTYDGSEAVTVTASDLGALTLSNIVETGSGNAVTDVQVFNGQLYFDRGATFLKTSEFTASSINAKLGLADWVFAANPPSSGVSGDYLPLSGGIIDGKVQMDALVINHNYNDTDNIGNRKLYVNGRAYVWGDLHVDGGIYVPQTTYIKIGEATITWDAQKGALKIDKPIYSTSGVAAKGPELVE